MTSSQESPELMSTELMSTTAAGRSGPATAVGAVAVAMLVGALTAICGSLVSRHAWRPGVMTLPWGMVLAVAGSAAAVVVARRAGRPYGFVAATGWVLGLLPMTGGPGGDVIIAADTTGYVFLICTTVVVLIAALWRKPAA